MSLLLYLALGALAVAVIFGLSTDVRAAARRLFHPRRQWPANHVTHGDGGAPCAHRFLPYPVVTPRGPATVDPGRSYGP